ncbi:MAG: hypothetical protein HYY95_04415 [Candidatus Rokubacteria bacterium]|nr:hypothetical protein [Candidatus Rokubacteria bacterium]
MTELLAGAVKTALHAAALPAPEAVAWEIPREAGHGDYATNVAMTLARPARRPPRQVAEAIVRHLPAVAAIERVEIAAPVRVGRHADARDHVRARFSDKGRAPSVEPSPSADPPVVVLGQARLDPAVMPLQ